MSSRQSQLRDEFDSPATYRICVQGLIPAAWADCFQGLCVETAAAVGREPETVLVGELRDQAALAGVLDLLYNLNVVVLSIVRLHR